MNYIFLFLLLLLSGCNDEKARHKGFFRANLFPCDEASYACKSSFNSPQDKWHVEPIKYTEPTEVAHEKLNKIILQNSRARILKLNPTYITAEYKLSLKVLDIYDDAEFLIMPERQEIHVRIESRSKLPDLGRIYRLIEEIRFKYFQNDVR
ncbi:MAG: DUF1499 domain-containing protein [Bdellovibrionota bacterium]